MPVEFEPPLAATGFDVFRLVASRFPPVSIFDRIAHPEDLDALFLVESMTNERLRDEAGDISLVPVQDRVVGPGSTPIMAAFTHLNPAGGRFTDGMFGAYYAGLDLATAVEETKYHRAQFLSATRQGPIEVDMRAYVARLDGQLHDVRTSAPPEIYHDSDYSAGQALGRRLREMGSNGVIYASVRRPEGTCVAVYKPRCLSQCRQERHLTYRWDGARIISVYEKSEFGPG